MFQYLTEIERLLEQVRSQEHCTMQAAIKLLTDAHLQQHSIYVFGASHAGILTEELFYRAGGLVTINPIFAPELSVQRSPITVTSQMERLVGYGKVIAESIAFKPNDVLLIHSVSGRNPVSIELALSAKQKGVKLIVLTNKCYSNSVASRHPSGKRLVELADIAIDNHGEKGDACCAIGDFKQKVGATSTVIGAAIVNALVVEVCQALLKQGIKQLPVFYSANLDSGDELNQALFAHYQPMIHYSW